MGTHLKMQFARTASRATASASRAVGGLSTARPASSIAPSALYDSLGAHGIDTYYGVPDSLLKDFCSYVTDTAPEGKHIIAANEGTACGLAAGYHLGTGKIPVVYLQNSGLGNTLNPIMSLMHPKVYSIPMLMMVGWRGEPGVKDEPQHTFMGACCRDHGCHEGQVGPSARQPGGCRQDDRRGCRVHEQRQSTFRHDHFKGHLRQVQARERPVPRQS